MSIRDKLFEFRQKSKRVLGWTFGVGFVIYGLGALYDDYDKSGWIPHHATVDMLMSSEWLQGESRECVGNMELENKRLPYIVKELRCPAWTQATEGHTLPVLFWGKVERTSPVNIYYLDDGWHGSANWRCARNSDSFTCRALD